MELNLRDAWCRALPDVLHAVPALAELVTIRNIRTAPAFSKSLVVHSHRCSFQASVGPDVRRGIKNYVRKHYDLGPVISWSLETCHGCWRFIAIFNQDIIFLTIDFESTTLKPLIKKEVFSMAKAYTKSHFTRAIAKANGLSRQKSTETVNILFEIIKQTLESSKDVLISGFGKFCVKDKGERRGRNPATGDEMMLRSRRVVTFKCSGKLREMINWWRVYKNMISVVGDYFILVRGLANSR